MQLTNGNTGLRLWLTTGLLFCFILVTDVAQRLHVPSVTVENKALIKDIPKKTESRLSEQELSNILSLFAHYDRPEPEVSLAKQDKLKQGMSAQEQSKQNGRLDKFYIDDSMYQLSGIFSEDNYFAILNQKGLSSGTDNEIKLKYGELLGDYEVIEISKTQIRFKLGQRIVELSMFKGE